MNKPILFGGIDANGLQYLIPYENIAYFTEYEGITRIYLRNVAGTTMPWYVPTKETMQAIIKRLSEMSVQ